MIARLQVARKHGMELRTNAIVLAQVWRDPKGRQTRLARLLRVVDVRPIDERMGLEAGILIGRARTTNAIDATVVLVARTATASSRAIPATSSALP
jgi:hypothetical protein